MILACETRGVSLGLFWFQNEKGPVLALFDVLDIAVARIRPTLKRKNRVLSEGGSSQGLRGYESGFLICTVFSNRREA
jgi:hypothetical protein